MKKQLRQLLLEGNNHEIADMAASRRRVLGLLISLTFDREPLIGWRAVEAMGAVAERLVDEDPDCVLNHVRRLYWLVTEESGGICWRAPEAIAEITRLRPKLLGEYIPIVVSFLSEMAEEDLLHFRAGTLWAIARLGPVAEEFIPSVVPEIVAALDNSNPQVRGMAVWCLGQTGRAELLADRSDLLEDEGPVDLYKDGSLERTSVCELARRVGEKGLGIGD